MIFKREKAEEARVYSRPILRETCGEHEPLWKLTNCTFANLGEFYQLLGQFA